MTQTDSVTKLGFKLIKALTDMVNAKTRLDVLYNSEEVHPETRVLIKRVSGHVGNGVAQFKRGLSNEYQQLFEESIIDENVALQVEGLTDMLVDLPQGIRDQCESYIEAQHRVYGSKSQF